VLKKITLSHLKPKLQQAAYKEVQILKNLDHPHIIKYDIYIVYQNYHDRYYNSFMEEDSIHIVMEFAE